jgi:ribosome-associated translation inhibitor RaiA
VIGAALDEDQREYVGRKLGMKLGKFASSIERVTVRVTDVNGPRGGVDQRCRVKVVLSGLPSVVVERRHARKEAAIDTALHATEESVRRVVGRRRTKPLHRRSSKTVRRAA